MSVDRYGNNKIVDESKGSPGVMATSRVGVSSRKKDESRFSTKAPAKHTILIVDDERHILKALRRNLSDENYKILTAESASEAIESISQQDISLIITDYRMPGTSGVELLRTVKEKYPGTIRIMLTGHADTDVVIRAVQEGEIYKFITKPWDDDDLKLSVKLALEQHDLIQENMRLRNITENQQREFNKLRRFTRSGHSTLGNILIAKNILQPEQLEVAEHYRKQQDTILAKSLIELGFVSEPDLIKVIQDESKAEFLVLENMDLDMNLSDLLPREACEKGCLVRIGLEKKNLQVAMADPLDLAQVEYIGFSTQCKVISLLARVKDIEKAIRLIYGDSDFGTDVVHSDMDYSCDQEEVDILLDEEKIETAEQLMAKSSTPPAILMVDTIIAGAIRSGASDIHVEPRDTDTLVRYRIDGLLRDMIRIPPDLYLPTISRIKILAKIDIASRRIPQDGRITVRSNNRFIDIRISTMPTINGEKVVCRLLDKNASIKSIHEIGIGGESLERFERMVDIPDGMIIATGPTGCGKTTSLYSMMKRRLSPTLNFITIEDPVEYLLEEATQIHIHQKAGLTFASSLRATLRQDPDVILVGEIRDNETAMAAFQAAMTGHLVFTTLHTNSTVGAISRLFHLGVKPYLVASAVQGIFAQRLVRKVCPICRELRDYDMSLLKSLGIGDNEFPEKLHYGKGCGSCDHMGYSGRTGLFEVFQMNEEFRHFLTTGYKETELLNMARCLGMETLSEDGLKKVKAGITTLEEILRVLGPAVRFDCSCSGCGKNIDLNFSICPYCKTQMRKICKNCKTCLEADWKVCPYCGGT